MGRVWIIRDGEMIERQTPDNLFPPIPECEDCGVPENVCICDMEMPDPSDKCADCGHRYDEHKGCAWIDTGRCEGGFWRCGCERFRRPTDPQAGEVGDGK